MLASKKIINQANKVLTSGNLLIFPTETVYGLGADATNNVAVKKIYKLKKRPLGNPIISHFENIEKVREHAELNNSAEKIAEIFWPGPLTLILKKRSRSNISPLVSNNNELIACRVPQNPIAQQILKKFSKPIAAPSANIFTKLSTTSIEHIHNKLRKNILIIDGGICSYGLESTVINLTQDNPIILRYGSITVEQFAQYLPKLKFKSIYKKKFISPGQQKKHYSPNIPIRINVKKVFNDEVLLNFGINNLASNIYELNLSKSSNLNEAARKFFYYLNQLDHKKFKKIAVAPIPNKGLGKTINDRLKRARAKK